MVTRPITEMPRNAVRQPTVSATHAASGTPPTVASVRPENMAATAPPALRRHDARRDDCTHTEKRAVIEGRDETSDEKCPVAVGKGGDEIADREDRHGQQEQTATGHVGKGQGHEGRADQHSEGVGADEKTRERDGDTKIIRNDGKHTHRRKFGHPDAKGTDRKGDQGRIETHERIPFASVSRETLRRARTHAGTVLDEKGPVPQVHEPNHRQGGVRRLLLVNTPC